MKAYQSWGRFPRAEHTVYPVNWRHQEIPFARFEQSVLPFGLGRSYGDVCLNHEGTLLDTEALNHFIHFDPETGVLDCEAGVRLSEMLEVFVPRGWFPPVVPGTRHVTAAGAMANDIHGKNHHRAGTFGAHVLGFELLRSNGERLFCSPEKNNTLYRATLGGMGLTGLVTWLRLQLKRVPGAWMEVEHVPFAGLEEFCAISRSSDEAYEYTVAWIDCVSGRGERGIFIRGNHAPAEKQKEFRLQPAAVRIPCEMPGVLVNPLTVSALNEIYYRAQSRRRQVSLTAYAPFFFPLDALENWNRLYGRKGFLQYQCVIPDDSTAVLEDILGRIRSSGRGSFLAVLKRFGGKASPGLMSFPMPGLTLALDFPVSEPVFGLLNDLDERVAAAGGRVYPAKDARMSPDHFRKFFPQLEEFRSSLDPAFSSDFKKRMHF